ncbi:hypothetical protein GCM10010199_12190 [Dactylosporangium roseum]
MQPAHQDHRRTRHQNASDEIRDAIRDLNMAAILPDGMMLPTAAAALRDEVATLAHVPQLSGSSRHGRRWSCRSHPRQATKPTAQFPIQLQRTKASHPPMSMRVHIDRSHAIGDERIGRRRD